MKPFKFFQKYASTLPNWYENYVVKKIYECRLNGTIPTDNIYYFNHYGEIKCIIIRRVNYDGLFPLRTNIIIDYELYHINPSGPNTFEDHSFTIDEEEFNRLGQSYERV